MTTLVTTSSYCDSKFYWNPNSAWNSSQKLAKKNKDKLPRSSAARLGCPWGCRRSCRRLLRLSWALSPPGSALQGWALRALVPEPGHCREHSPVLPSLHFCAAWMSCSPRGAWTGARSLQLKTLEILLFNSMGRCSSFMFPVKESNPKYNSVFLLGHCNILSFLCKWFS